MFRLQSVPCARYLSAQLRASEEFVYRGSSPPRAWRVIAVLLLLLVRVERLQRVTSLAEDIPFLSLKKKNFLKIHIWSENY